MIHSNDGSTHWKKSFVTKNQIERNPILKTKLTLKLFALCLLPLPGWAVPITWTNVSGGSWSVANNWSSHTVPGSFDDVSITLSGTYTVTMDVSPTISSLALGGASGVQTLTNSSQTLTVSHASAVNANGVFGMSAGTMGGAGIFTVNGQIIWNGGSLGTGGSLILAASAIMNIKGSLTLLGSLNNQGTVNWQAGNLTIDTNGAAGQTGTIVNQAGALFDIQCDQSLTSAGLSPASFHNAGLLRKTVTTGFTSFSVFLANSGVVHALTGTLTFFNGSDLGGSFQADSGAVIDFNGSSFVLSSPPNFQGPGAVQFIGGNLTLNNFTGALTLNGINLAGQSTIAATGTINLKGSSLIGGATLTVLSNAMLNIQAAWTLLGSLNNQGTVNWQTGTLTIDTNSAAGQTGTIVNQAGALFDIQCDQGLTSGGLSPASFHNAGLLRKTVTTGFTSFSVFLENSGTVHAQTGTLTFFNGSDLGGSFQADSGAVIDFNGSSFVLSSPPNFQGPGGVQFIGGNMTLNNFTGALTLNGINLAGQSTIAATGTINLKGSSLIGGATLTVLSNAVLNIQAAWTLLGALNNQGTVNWQAGSVTIDTNNAVGQTGTIVNQAGALFDIQCDQGLTSGGSSPASFHNTGLLRKSSGSSTTTISVNLLNTGTIQAQTGSIGIQGSYSEGPAATLAVSLAGTTPGMGFGRIQFGAAPTFAGTFAVDTLNGYRPNSGNSFLVITYPSHAGGFIAYNGLNLGGGLLLTQNLAATGLTLTANGATTSLAGISLSGANVVLKGVNGRLGNTNLTLMSTNLARPLNQWSPIVTNILTADGNFNITLTNAVSPGVRQKFFILQVQ